MDAAHLLHFLSSKSPPSITPLLHTNPSTIKTTITIQTQIFLPRHGRSTRLNSTIDTNKDVEPSITPSPPPADTVEIRFKRGSRRRSKRQRREDVSSGGQPAKAQQQPPKKWEDMNLTEKAVEVYMGEKGLLFWLNKFAYASIFIMIGGWILFRFLGPSLHLYQLDTPPLSPSSVFKGS